jgi:hypothetical protein
MTRLELVCENCDSILPEVAVSYLPDTSKNPLKGEKIHLRKRLGSYCPEPCGPVVWRSVKK